MKRGRVLALGFCALIAGCAGLTQSPFRLAATEAAGTLAAAAETLVALDEDRLTDAYARASFVSFAEALDGAAEGLAAQQGAPPGTDANRLSHRLGMATELVRAPCIGEERCDRPGQIAMLRAVSSELLEAAGE